MTLNSHVIKLKHIVIILGILSGIATGLWRASAWAQNVKNGIEAGVDKDKQQDTLIADITITQKQMFQMMRTMFVIDSLERAGDTKLMARVYAITNCEDTIPEDTLGTNEWSTEYTEKDSLE